MYSDSLAVSKPGYDRLNEVNKKKDINGNILDSDWKNIVSKPIGDISKPYERLLKENGKPQQSKNVEIHTVDKSNNYMGSYNVAPYKKPTQKIYYQPSEQVVSVDTTSQRFKDNPESSKVEILVEPKQEVKSRYGTTKSGAGTNYYYYDDSKGNRNWLAKEDYDRKILGK